MNLDLKSEGSQVILVSGRTEVSSASRRSHKLKLKAERCFLGRAPKIEMAELTRGLTYTVKWCRVRVWNKFCSSLTPRGLAFIFHTSRIVAVLIVELLAFFTQRCDRQLFPHWDRCAGFTETSTDTHVGFSHLCHWEWCDKGHPALCLCRQDSGHWKLCFE